MEKTLSFNKSKYWTLPLLSGTLFLILGILTIAEMGISYKILSVIFAFSFIASGIFEFFFARENRDLLPGWRWTATSGALSAILGVVLLIQPQIAMASLPFYIAFMIIFRSLNGIGFSYELKDFGILEWGNLLMVSSAGLVLGFFFLWNPGFAAISAMLMISFGLIFIALNQIYFGIMVKKMQKEVDVTMVAKADEDDDKQLKNVYVDLNVTDKKTGEKETVNIISEELTDSTEDESDDNTTDPEELNKAS